MDTPEYDLLRPVPGLAVKRDRKHLELSPAKKLSLTQWGTSQQYDIFLELCESIIEVAETEHFQKYKSKEEFERTGLVAVAMRIFFERLQSEINHQVEEFAGELDFIRAEQETAKTSPEEMIQKSFGPQ